MYFRYKISQEARATGFSNEASIIISQHKADLSIVVISSVWRERVASGVVLWVPGPGGGGGAGRPRALEVLLLFLLQIQMIYCVLSVYMVLYY